VAMQVVCIDCGGGAPVAHDTDGQRRCWSCRMLRNDARQHKPNPKKYDPSNVIVTFGGVPVTGFGDAGAWTVSGPDTFDGEPEPVKSARCVCGPEEHKGEVQYGQFHSASGAPFGCEGYYCEGHIFSILSVDPEGRRFEHLEPPQERPACWGTEQAAICSKGIKCPWSTVVLGQSSIACGIERQRRLVLETPAPMPAWVPPAPRHITYCEHAPPREVVESLIVQCGSGLEGGEPVMGPTVWTYAMRREWERHEAFAAGLGITLARFPPPHEICCFYHEDKYGGTMMEQGIDGGCICRLCGAAIRVLTLPAKS
jgi:hypothetical protein